MVQIIHNIFFSRCFLKLKYFSHFCIDFVKIFKTYVTIETPFNQYEKNRYQLPVTSYCAWKYVSAFRYRAKARKVLRLNNQIKLILMLDTLWLCTSVFVFDYFRFFEWGDAGVENRYSNSDHFGGIFHT